MTDRAAKVVLPRCEAFRLRRVDLGDSSVFDAEFLTEQLDLLIESVVFGSKAQASVGDVGGPAPGAGDGVVSQ
jgi:hypothetical protein